VLFLVCVALAWLALSKHRWGRYLYAIGGNEEAARLSGVPVVSAKICAYAASGLFAAVAGLCQAAQEQQGDPEAGQGYELTAIAMVVIGGTSLMGGRGGMGLTLLGVLTIGYLDKILSINAVPEAGRLVLTGIIIVAAVLTQRRGRT
jgi:ribose/xylose/arabinose/galactoside ABC-type transport system permease subunit